MVKENLQTLLLIVAMKLFIDRMIARKQEEFESIKASVHYVREEVKKENPKITEPEFAERISVSYHTLQRGIQTEKDKFEKERPEAEAYPHDR